jgi:hypothetical protein
MKYNTAMVENQLLSMHNSRPRIVGERCFARDSKGAAFPVALKAAFAPLGGGSFSEQASRADFGATLKNQTKILILHCFQAIWPKSMVWLYCNVLRKS